LASRPSLRFSRACSRVGVADPMASPRQHKIVGCGNATREFHLAAKRSHFHQQIYAGNLLVKGGARMALSLRDVRCDPIANRALNELMHHYTVAQEKGRLVLTKKTGDMKLFLNDLDDLHQWDFMRNQQMVKEIERLRVLLTTTNQH